MATLETIQSRLAEAITQSEFSQSEIARKVGIKQSQISCYKHGRKMPALDTFARLCEVLEADPAYILGIDN